MECSCRLCPIPGMYVVTSIPFVSRTRATFRSAEFGFLGVDVYTLVHTPLRCGLPCKAGLFVFSRILLRPIRTSWLKVGNYHLLFSFTAAATPATPSLTALSEKPSEYSKGVPLCQASVQILFWLNSLQDCHLDRGLPDRITSAASRQNMEVVKQRKRANAQGTKNKGILVGRLGSEPEERRTTKETNRVKNFSLQWLSSIKSVS